MIADRVTHLCTQNIFEGSPWEIQKETFYERFWIKGESKLGSCVTDLDVIRLFFI